jgi:hypothetical protein
MGTTADHRRHAQECIAKAQCAEEESDKALWLTLAQSWVRLAEVARSTSQMDGDAVPLEPDVEEVPEAASANED